MKEQGKKIQPKETNADAMDLAQVETLIEVTDEDFTIQTINIISRGALHSQGDCLRFVHTIHQLVMKVHAWTDINCLFPGTKQERILDKKSLGTAINRCYLSHSSITQHEDHLISYSEEEIHDVQALKLWSVERQGKTD